jgi:hypothetical protein
VGTSQAFLQYPEAEDVKQDALHTPVDYFEMA